MRHVLTIKAHRETNVIYVDDQKLKLIDDPDLRDLPTNTCLGRRDAPRISLSVISDDSRAAVEVFQNGMTALHFRLPTQLRLAGMLDDVIDVAGGSNPEIQIWRTR